MSKRALDDSPAENAPPKRSNIGHTGPGLVVLCMESIVAAAAENRDDTYFNVLLERCDEELESTGPLSAATLETVTTSLASGLESEDKDIAAASIRAFTVLTKREEGAQGLLALPQSAGPDLLVRALAPVFVTQATANEYLSGDSEGHALQCAALRLTLALLSHATGVQWLLNHVAGAGLSFSDALFFAIHSPSLYVADAGVDVLCRVVEDAELLRSLGSGSSAAAGVAGALLDGDSPMPDANDAQPITSTTTTTTTTTATTTATTAAASPTSVQPLSLLERLAACGHPTADTRSKLAFLDSVARLSQSHGDSTVIVGGSGSGGESGGGIRGEGTGSSGASVRNGTTRISGDSTWEGQELVVSALALVDDDDRLVSGRVIDSLSTLVAAAPEPHTAVAALVSKARGLLHSTTAASVGVGLAVLGGVAGVEGASPSAERLELLELLACVLRELCGVTGLVVGVTETTTIAATATATTTAGSVSTSPTSTATRSNGVATTPPPNTLQLSSLVKSQRVWLTVQCLSAVSKYPPTAIASSADLVHTLCAVVGTGSRLEPRIARVLLSTVASLFQLVVDGVQEPWMNELIDGTLACGAGAAETSIVGAVFKALSQLPVAVVVHGSAARTSELASFLKLKLMDASWEVKDSTLNFVAHLWSDDAYYGSGGASSTSVEQAAASPNKTADSEEDTVPTTAAATPHTKPTSNTSGCDSSPLEALPLRVFRKLADTEAYVRGSALDALAALSTHPRGWCALTSTAGEVVSKVCSLAESDESSTPRIAALNLLAVWLSHEHSRCSELLVSQVDRVVAVIGGCAADEDWTIRTAVVALAAVVWESVGAGAPAGLLDTLGLGPLLVAMVNDDMRAVRQAVYELVASVQSEATNTGKDCEFVTALCAVDAEPLRQTTVASAVYDDIEFSSASVAPAAQVLDCY